MTPLSFWFRAVCVVQDPSGVASAECRQQGPVAVAQATERGGGRPDGRFADLQYTVLHGVVQAELIQQQPQCRLERNAFQVERDF